MIDVLKLLLGKPLEAGFKFFSRRSELKDARHERELALIEKGQRDDTALARLDIANSGWKDEFWTLTLAAPFIGAFVPGLQEYIRDGFAIIETFPTWAQYYLGVSVLTAFGWRGVRSLKKQVTDHAEPTT